MIKFRDTKPTYGYNLTDGGEGTVSLKRTPEQCTKTKKDLPKFLASLQIIYFSVSSDFYLEEPTINLRTISTGIIVNAIAMTNAHSVIVSP